MRRGGSPIALAMAWFALAAARAAAGETSGFLTPAEGEGLAPGAIVEVRWESLCRARSRDIDGKEIDEAELVLSLDGGRTFPVRVTPELHPCSSRFLWKVPALATAHARLALRAGSEERGETEAIKALSGEFRILPDPDGRVEQLRRRAAEMWTPSDPVALTAEDLLGETLSAGRGGRMLPAPIPEAGVPAPFSYGLRPERVSRRHGAARANARWPSSLSLLSNAGCLTPLRL